MFPATIHNALARDDIRRRESQIGPHDDIPGPSHLSRPPTATSAQLRSAVIKEGQEDEEARPQAGSSGSRDITHPAESVEQRTSQGQMSLPSIHSLFGIAGVGGANETKTQSVSDVAQRAGTSASSLMDIFPSPFSEYRNPPEDFSSPTFSGTSRLPRLHRQSSASLYASSSSARDSLSSSISLVTPTTNLTLESGADELERRESYATFAEEIERRRMSDNLPLGRRLMTLSQADEALRIRMGRNESYPSSAIRQIKQEGKVAPSLLVDLPDPSQISRFGFAFTTSRPSSSSSAANERRVPSHSNLGVVSHSSSPTPEPLPVLSSNKRPSAETIGPRKRLRSRSPPTSSTGDPLPRDLGHSSLLHVSAGALLPDERAMAPRPDREKGEQHTRLPLLNRSESVPHLRHLAESTQQVSSLSDHPRRSVHRVDPEMRPHTVQSATCRDFPSRAGTFSAGVIQDGVWLGNNMSHLPGLDNYSSAGRRRLSLEGIFPNQDGMSSSVPFGGPYHPAALVPNQSTSVYDPANTRYPPFTIQQPFPFYQVTPGPLFSTGPGVGDPGSDRRASLSASNLEATVALGIPHGVVLTQLPDASTKDRMGNPTVGPRYGCDFCGKTFSRPSSLKIHIYTHTGEKPYICTWPNCNRQFSVQSNLKRHAKVHHEQAGLSEQEVNLNESPDMHEEYTLHHHGTGTG